jgi:hypothetical protein
MMKYLRKNLTILFVLLALSAVSSAGVAAETMDKPRTFVHSYELITTLEGAIYRFTLPGYVYKGLIQSQMRDLAVFNAREEIVPFAIREAAPVYRVAERPERSMPFYELPHESRAENSVEPLDVYVQTGANGQIVSVKSGNKNKEVRERRYILDFSAAHTDRGEIIKRGLRLTLPDVKLSAKLSVFESANLRDWNPLLTDAPLLQLKNEASRLTSDSVELPRTPRRYVLLRIWDVDQSFELKGVGYSVSVRNTSIREEESTYIDGTFVTDAAKVSAVEYDALGAFPISKVNFELKEPGFYRITYFSRPEAKGNWSMRGKMELSMIANQYGSMKTNEPVSINMCEDRYWRIVFEGTFSGLPPEMKIIWHPSDVFFLAQGGGPYVLAFGSSLKNKNLQNASFLKDANALEAKIGSYIDRGQDAELTTVENVFEDAEWQRYLVLILLVMGGMLLSFMALKLMKKQT